ncbi:MAG: hypothetical protein WCX17_04385 [Parcubacteria group bacterium]
MHNLYKKTQEKIEQLKVSAAAAYCQGKDTEITETSKRRFFSLNIRLAWLEFIFNLMKLLIIIMYDSGTVFKIFYQNSNIDACLFPYRTFKVIHKKIRVLSYVSIIIVVSAALMANFSDVSAWR